jgi:hypothetical protein
MSEHTSELDWERFVLGELPGERSRILRDLLAGNPELRQKVESLERSNREDLARYPAGSVVPGIRERFLRESSGPISDKTLRRSPVLKHLLFLSPALAAALILAFVILPTKRNGVAPDLRGSLPDTQTIKGAGGLDLSQTQLLVYRQRNREVEQMSSGQTAKAGDVMQLAFVSARRYGVILSIDGVGTVSLHFPDRAEAGTDLEPNKRITLPQAIELDDAPSFERFFFVTSAVPIDVRTVLQAAADLAREPRRAERTDLTLPSGLEQTSFLIRK